MSIILNELESRLRSLRNPSTPELRVLRREFSKRLAKSPAAEVVALADALIDLPGFEHRFLAYELIADHREALGSLRAGDLERLGRGMASWQEADTFACYLSGPVWRRGQVSDALIRRWARSPDRWLRRAALVSTVPLNNRARGGAGDPQRTLEVCRMLLADRDDMVKKAMSWALRELAKRDASAVEAFIVEHGDRLAARALRETRNKLRTGLKNPRRA